MSICNSKYVWILLVLVSINNSANAASLILDGDLTQSDPLWIAPPRTLGPPEQHFDIFPFFLEINDAVAASTCSSSTEFDTVLFLYGGSFDATRGTNNLIGSQDDDFTCPFNVRASTLIVEGLLANTQYYLVATSFDRNVTGHYALNLFTNSGGVSRGLIEVSPIPVPAAAWLFSTALIGLIGFSKRRKAA